MTRALSTAVLLLFAAGSAFGADICKWLDEGRRVHYSDVKPPNRDCKEVITVVHPDPDEVSKAVERRRRQAAEIAKQEEARQARRLDAEQQAQDLEERERKCKDAEAELKFLESASDMRLVRPGKEADEGPFDWLDDKEREELTEAWRKQVGESCGPARAEASGAEPGRAYGAPLPIKELRDARERERRMRERDALRKRRQQSQ